MASNRPQSTPVEIDKEGTVYLGARTIPIPRAISPAARTYLATPPWGDATQPAPQPMWELRTTVDGFLKLLSEQARGTYPVEIEERKLAGVRTDLVSPKGISGGNHDRVLINLHGGGFVLGSGSLIEAIPIASLTNMRVVAVDYRLAPEHPFPAAVDDVVAVYKALLESHKPAMIGLYGSSAGAILTAQTAVRLRQLGLPLPAALGVFSGSADLSDFGDSAAIYTLSGFWGDLIRPLNDPGSEVKAYVGGHDSRDPLVSPMYADLKGFPPTLLMSGTRDALLSGTTSFHRALRRAGVEADLFVFEAMPHCHWYLVDLPESREALEIMARFFASKLGK